MKTQQTFEEYLQKKFTEEREINGVPITKDNYEDMYDNWLQNLDVQELIDFGEEYGLVMFAKGMKEAESVAQQEIGDGMMKQDLHDKLKSAMQEAETITKLAKDNEDNLASIHEMVKELLTKKEF